jgi:hypothetical protein
MKGRRTAILTRREQEKDVRKHPGRIEASPTSPIETNGVGPKALKSIEVSQSPPIGFTAVNLRQPGEQDRRTILAGNEPFSTPSAGNITIINGRSIKDASPTERAEMMKNFLSHNERDVEITEESLRRGSFGGTTRTQAMQTNTEKPRSLSIELTGASSSTVAIPNTPASLMPLTKAPQSDKDDGGPFKAEMVRRMDTMWKGDRVIPPCDRCRRLHMDCQKNLTACIGCTKKHAKCSWKEVKPEEMENWTGPPSPPGASPKTTSPEPFHLRDAAPMSAGSTIEVSHQPEDEPRPNVGRESTDVVGAKADASKDIAQQEPKEDVAAKRASAPPVTTTKLDVRPPPLVQQLQEAATGRSQSGPSPSAPAFSPRREYDDDDGGDRLEALAARIHLHRSTSQGGQRA